MVYMPVTLRSSSKMPALGCWAQPSSVAVIRCFVVVSICKLETRGFVECLQGSINTARWPGHQACCSGHSAWVKCILAVAPPPPISPHPPWCHSYNQIFSCHILFPVSDHTLAVGIAWEWGSSLKGNSPGLTPCDARLGSTLQSIQPTTFIGVEQPSKMSVPRGNIVCTSVSITFCCCKYQWDCMPSNWARTKQNLGSRLSELHTAQTYGISWCVYHTQRGLQLPLPVMIYTIIILTQEIYKHDHEERELVYWTPHTYTWGLYLLIRPVESLIATW